MSALSNITSGLDSADASTSASAPADRIAWLDTARGLAIALVVVYHAVLYGLAVGVVPSGWSTLNDLLAGFRMPVFFFVSGMLSRSALRRPWRQVLHTRLALWLYLYVLWVTITILAAQVFENVRGEGFGRGLDAFGVLELMFAAPITGIWYLLALPIFLIATRLAQPLPPVVQIALAFAASAVLVVLDPIQDGNFTWRYIAMYFPFFFLGCHGSEIARRMTAWTSPGKAVALLAAYAGIFALSRLLPEGAPRPGLHLVLGVGALVAGIAVAIVVTEHPLSRPLRSLGSKTLPIYVMHELLLSAFATGVLLRLEGELTPVIGWILPVLMAAVCVAVALVLHRALRRVPGLFALPGPLAPSPRSGPGA